MGMGARSTLLIASYSLQGTVVLNLAVHAFDCSMGMGDFFLLVPLKKKIKKIIAKHVLVVLYKFLLPISAGQMLFLGTLLKERQTFSWLQELYHELHALDRFEQDYRRKLQEEDNSNTTQRGTLLLAFPFHCHMIILSAYIGLLG